MSASQHDWLTKNLVAKHRNTRALTFYCDFVLFAFCACGSGGGGGGLPECHGQRQVAVQVAVSAQTQLLHRRLDVLFNNNKHVLCYLCHASHAILATHSPAKNGWQIMYYTTFINSQVHTKCLSYYMYIIYVRTLVDVSRDIFSWKLSYRNVSIAFNVVQPGCNILSFALTNL